MNGLYVEIKKNQFGFFPTKDSIICLDMIFRVKTSKIDNFVNTNNKVFNETTQATLEFQIDILKRMLETTKNPPTNFFYIEYDEHKFFQKYSYDEKGMVVNIVGKVLYGNIHGLEQELKNTMDNDITSFINLNEINSSFTNPLFINKMNKNLNGLKTELKIGIQLKEKELNDLKNDNKIKEQIIKIDKKIEETNIKYNNEINDLTKQKQKLLDDGYNETTKNIKNKNNNERER